MAVLASRLNFIADAADEAMALALHDTADFILSLIRLYVPVRTGWLRDSYQQESVSLLHIIVGSMVNYAVYQEYGTSRMAAQPHLVPAFLQAETFFQSRVKHYIENLG